MKKLKDILIEATVNKIKGGLADNTDINSLDQKELLRGIKVELEHTDDILTAIEIAADHLVENPKYYQELSKIEKH